MQSSDILPEKSYAVHAAESFQKHLTGPSDASQTLLCVLKTFADCARLEAIAESLQNCLLTAWHTKQARGPALMHGESLGQAQDMCECPQTIAVQNNTYR